MCITCGVKHAHGTWQSCPDSAHTLLLWSGRPRMKYCPAPREHHATTGWPWRTGCHCILYVKIKESYSPDDQTARCNIKQSYLCVVASSCEYISAIPSSPMFLWTLRYFTQLGKPLGAVEGRAVSGLCTWLPDGYSQILRVFVFGPSGLKDYGSATLQNVIPSMDCPPHWIQGMDGIKFCHLATLDMWGD